jgi:prepilin-type N-terminal cleavage/methylation domain-containing protein
VRSGFTLVELLVVIVLMGLMVGLVAPAVIPRPVPDDRGSLGPVIRFAREAALRRSEIVRVRIDPSGAWRADGASSVEDGPLASGRLDGYDHGEATLVASPIGTCSFDARSFRVAHALRLDPLTCEVGSTDDGREAAP